LTSCTYTCGNDPSCVVTTTTTSTTTSTTTIITTTTTSIPITTTTSTTTTTTSTTVISYDFQIWVERQGVITVGKPTPFLIYVQNLGVETDSYTVTYLVNYEHPPGYDLSHLIQIHLVSDRIEQVDSNGIRETQGTMRIIGQIYPPGATITFRVESDNSGGTKETSIEISGGESSGLPRTLPEFSLIGFLQLLLLAGLVVFYSSHIR